MIEGTIAMTSSRFLRAVSALSSLIVASATANPTLADVLYTGDGASAGVYALGQESVQSGSIPATIDESTSVNFTRYDSNGNPYSASVPVAVDASASATPGASTLLQLRLSLSAPDIGTISAGNDPVVSSDAGAQWGNVTTTVQAPSGSQMPSSIRLEFQVNYPAADLNLYQGAGLRSAYLSFTGAPMVPLPAAGTAIESGEQAAQVQPNGTLAASFHMDVPLSPSGVSTSPFSVLLSDWISELSSNRTTSINDALSVSLKGIYLPDGTSLTADGYSVTFDSAAGPIRLLPETATPEPATWAAWSVIATAGALMLRRHRARM